MSATPREEETSTAGGAATVAPAIAQLHPEPLEEDDDFEEFREEAWGEESKNTAAKEQWADDWDDEDVDAEFDAALALELEKTSGVAAAAGGGGSNSGGGASSGGGVGK